MRKHYYCLLIFLAFLQMACSEIDSEFKDDSNFISVDGKKYELSQFLTYKEEFKEPNGYSIESWIWPSWPDPKEGYGVSLFFVSSSPNSVDEGFYKIVAEDAILSKREAAGELDVFIGNGTEEDLKEGTLEVKKENGVYTIKLEAVTDKSKKVIAFFKGNLILIAD